MKLSIPSIAIILVCSFVFMLPLTEGRSCDFVEHTLDRCRGPNYMRVAGQVIHKRQGEVVVPLPYFQTEATWYCGQSKERVAWGEVANELRIHYGNDGKIAWNIYFCRN